MLRGNAVRVTYLGHSPWSSRTRLLLLGVLPREGLGGGTVVTRSSLTTWSLSSSFFFSGSWLVMCHFTGVLLLSCCHIHQAHGHDPARWCSMKYARSSLMKYARSSSLKPCRWGMPDLARWGSTKYAKSSLMGYATMKRCVPDSAQWGMPSLARWNMQDPA